MPTRAALHRRSFARQAVWADLARLQPFGEGLSSPHAQRIDDHGDERHASLPGVALGALARREVSAGASNPLVDAQLGIWSLKCNPLPREPQHLLPPQAHAHRDNQ